MVADGATTTFTVTPDSGYTASATGCDGSLSGTTYTTGPITAACTVSASFEQAGLSVSESAGSTLVDEDGSSDSFTVVLTAKPNSDVVLDLSSADTGEATVSPATLTFTNANWDAPQSVTVTGVDDALVDGDQRTDITLSVVDASSDDAFDGLANETLSVTTTDDDTAGLDIVESDGNTQIQENGSSDSFTVRLTSQPLSAVVLDVSSPDSGEASVDPASLTFTNTNWDQPQTVTVTGVNDDLIDGNQTTQIQLAVDADASDDTYDALGIRQVATTTLDDDTAEFTVAETDGDTLISEDGSTDSLSVVLNTQPDSDVTIAVGSDNTAEATVSPSRLTFTSSDWDQAQSVTVTGVDDAFIDGPQESRLTFSVAADSDPNFVGLYDWEIGVTTRDDDTAGFTLSETDGDTQVSEGATTDLIEVVLNARPSSDVILLVSSTDTDEASVSPASLTFTSANWDSPQQVVVTGVDDTLIDGEQRTLLTFSVDPGSDTDFLGVADEAVSVTTSDDDSAGLTLTETAGTTQVSESGTTDSVTLVLNAGPASDVVVQVSSADTGEVTASPASLTFTPANWDQPQTVTLTGVDDSADDGDQTTTVTFGIDAARSDDAYDGLANRELLVGTTDNDFTVTPSAGLNGRISPDTPQVATANTQVTFTVTPDSGYTASATGCDGTLSGTTYTTGPITGACTVTATFSQDSYTVNATAGEHGSIDPASRTVAHGGTTTFTVTPDSGYTASATGCGGNLSGNTYTTGPITAACTVSASFSLTPVTHSVTATAGAHGGIDPASRTVADGATTTFTVTPDSGYTASVGGTCGGSLSGSTYTTGAITADCTVSASFSLTPVTHSVTATAGDHGSIDPASRMVADGATTTFTVTPDSGYTASATGCDGSLSGTTYTTGPITAACTVSASFEQAGLSVSESAGSTLVDEDGSSDSFTVVLTAKPNSDVVLDLSSADTGEATVSPATLTFTNANWDAPQSVTVTGVDDALVDGDQRTDITLSVVDASSDDAFDGLANETLSVTTTDDDTAGLDIVESDGNTQIQENGSSDSFTVRLTSQPLSAVVLDVSSPDSGEASVDPASLTFTNTNWDQPQTVTVTGVNDDLIDGNQTTQIQLAVDADASDDTYDALGIRQVATTTLDDDTAEFTVAETDGDTLISEDGSTDSLSVVLNTQPDSDVTIAVGSDNTAEATVSPSRLTFTSSDWDQAQSVTVTGVDDAFIDGPQESRLTFSVAADSDPNFVGLYDWEIGVTTRDDDTAGFTLSETDGDTQVSEGATTDLIEVVLNARPSSDVILLVSSTDTDEASVSPASLTFTSANWDSPQQVVVTGVDDALIDGEQRTLLTFSVDPGSDTDFLGVADEAVSVTTSDDDSAGLTLTETAGTTQVSESGTTDSVTLVLNAGPASDVVVQVSSADTGEVTASPASLTFTPANWDQPQTVTLTGVDDSTDDGDQTTTVTFGIDAARSDDAYDGLANRELLVGTTDNDFTVTPSAGLNGRISPDTPQVATANTQVTFTVTPDSGYTASATGCDGTLSGTTYTTGPITGACTVTATFSQSRYSITPAAGANGSLSPAGAQTVIHGATTTFTVTPASGYGIASVSGCGGTLNGGLYTTGPITGDCTVSASFSATNTTTAITRVNPSPSKIGQAVTVNFGVTSTETGLNGTVMVTAQDGTTCSDAVTTAGTSVTGSCQLTFATAGAKTLIARYSGTADSSASAGTNHLVADTPTLATPSLNSGVVGVPYAMQLVASGGVAPYTFSSSDSDLAGTGLTLSGSGLLSGTPASPQTPTLTLIVTDALGQTSTRDYPLTLINQLTVATTSLPDGLVNAPYIQTLEAVGGQTPYVWSLASGSLPVGLTLDPATGRLSGTPTAIGTSASFTIRVTDAANRRADQALTLTTTAPNVVKTGTVDGAAFTVSGNLTPEGGGATCTLDDQTTRIVNVATPGDPDAPPVAPDDTTLPYGLLKFTVQGCTPGATRLTVRLVYPDALPVGTRYWKYGKTADTPTDHWYVLPTAVIAGNTVSFSITDGGLGDDDLSANGSITDPGGPGDPILTIGGTPGAGRVGSAYNAALTVTDGSGPNNYVWSLAAGGLPPGVTLNAVTGALTGTPTLAGTFNFSVQLVDIGNANASTTRAFGVTIAAAGGGGAVNGTCGSAHNGLFDDLPTNPSALCASGTPSTISGSGPWSWSCLGSNGGSPASCNASLATVATYTVTTSARTGGTLSPPSRVVNAGDTATFTLIPATGYAISSASGCGGTLSGSTYTTGAITGACTVSATFSQVSYSVTATAGDHGGIDPVARTVAHGGTTNFTVTPDTGYTASVGGTCDGSLSGTTYTTSAITTDCTIVASFSAVPTATAIPTLSTWGMMLLMGLLVLLGAVWKRPPV
ncbi:beta strand repeat-containing protein [Allochromatium palmeri]|nr:IPTL-CTERM sorting domain-containing protein [Allochromatium palmeri]